MPPSPKAHKKAGAPKAKGAVRAKSGCYTCRIRRKKCDEEPDEHGHCRTCIRLKLECLGFGAKRPDWLRDNRNVVELREKIKVHLASQGMIKGHSGSGPRSSEQESNFLRLHEYDDSSVSPPTPTLSLDDHHRHGLVTSSIRDDNAPYHLPPPHGYPHGHHGHHVQELSPDSPMGSQRQLYGGTDVMLPAPYPAPLNHMSHPTLPLPSTSWSAAASNSNNALLPFAPTSRSTFSPTYYRNYDEYDEDKVPEPLSVDPMSLPGIPPFHSANYLPPHEMDTMVCYYMNHVVGIQYLFADEEDRRVIKDSSLRQGAIGKAVKLLANVHRTRINNHHENDGGYEQQYADVCDELLPAASAPTRIYNEDDAMAGLHVVSAFLFTGGSGAWPFFLEIAHKYTENALYDPRYASPADALLRAPPSTRFVCKATMWFDVLAAASQGKAPYFHGVYQELFAPSDMRVDGARPEPPPALNMLPVMGCENHIFWALSETSWLAHWKAQQLSDERLSVPELVERGMRIDRELQVPSRDPGPHAGDVPLSRFLTSEIFRHSARVYLHTVLSDSWPLLREIDAGVQATIKVLKGAQAAGLQRTVVRSVVFGMFLCGCLAKNHAQKDFFREMLQLQTRETVGNCGAVLELMEQVWRQPRHKDLVRWREPLTKSGILLV